MTSDPNDRLENPSEMPAEQPAGPESASSAPAAEGSEVPPESEGGDQAGQSGRRRVLIGSQRNPAAYRPKPKRDWEPIVEKTPQQAKPDKAKPDKAATDKAAALAQSPPASQPEQQEQQEQQEQPPAAAAEETAPAAVPPPAPPAAPPVREAPPAAAIEPAEPRPDVSAPAAASAPIRMAPLPGSSAVEPPEPPAAAEPAIDSAREPIAEAPSTRRFPPPNIRGRLPADLEEEFQQALGGVELGALIDQTEAVTKQAMLEPDTRCRGRVALIRHRDVFVELGGREQGILPLENFEAPPEIGSEIEVRVARFNREDGLYELSLPHGATSVEDWSDLEEGMVVEARITGHNAGGLECDVNHIRGFIPISQIALYRVENIEEFVGEKMRCVVTEANPARRNLVLSHRALLEREREEARKQLLATLEPGQVYEGTVRKLMDFGAFVELGSGVDGLLHVSELGWGRVSHPSEVVSEGQAVKVKIKKYDPATGRISLAYREMLPDPWEEVEQKYPQGAQVPGKVTKLMEFGAFVELEPGVEGLVHISELSHKKIWRVSDVVQEGEPVEVRVQSIDRAARRISLSIKDLTPAPETETKGKGDNEPGEPAQKSKVQRSAKKPLKGGVSRSSDGDKFGLKW